MSVRKASPWLGQQETQPSKTPTRIARRPSKTDPPCVVNELRTELEVSLVSVPRGSTEFRDDTSRNRSMSSRISHDRLTQISGPWQPVKTTVRVIGVILRSLSVEPLSSPRDTRYTGMSWLHSASSTRSTTTSGCALRSDTRASPSSKSAPDRWSNPGLILPTRGGSLQSARSYDATRRRSLPRRCAAKRSGVGLEDSAPFRRRENAAAYSICDGRDGGRHSR